MSKLRFGFSVLVVGGILTSLAWAAEQPSTPPTPPLAPDKFQQQVQIQSQQAQKDLQDKSKEDLANFLKGQQPGTEGSLSASAPSGTTNQTSTPAPSTTTPATTTPPAQTQPYTGFRTSTPTTTPSSGKTFNVYNAR